MEPADYQPRLKIECLLDKNEEVSLQLVRELAMLEPLGCDNQPPLFAFKDAVVHYPKAFGRDNNHLRFIPITASTIITVLCGTVRLIWPAFIITRLSIWRLCPRSMSGRKRKA